VLQNTGLRVEAQKASINESTKVEATEGRRMPFLPSPYLQGRFSPEDEDTEKTELSALEFVIDLTRLRISSPTFLFNAYFHWSP